jgi:hypothetical protein
MTIVTSGAQPHCPRTAPEFLLTFNSSGTILKRPFLYKYIAAKAHLRSNRPQSAPGTLTPSSIATGGACPPNCKLRAQRTAGLAPRAKEACE